MSVPQAAAASQTVYQRIVRNIGGVVRGEPRVLRHLLAAYAAGGHVLLEDVPGTGKTTLAKALATSIGVAFRRVQFTPDLLPSDILGVSVFNPRDQTFEFHKGPVFTQILLADEINRASPRTQSALLEVMAEGQVTVEGTTSRLDDFFVIATQNPVEYRGTYPLPEAQMDRFAIRLSLGYLSADAEADMLADQAIAHPLASLRACASLDEVRALRSAVGAMPIARELQRYVVDLVRETRQAARVTLGAGPRASLALSRTAQALALFDGSAFVTPEHVREMAIPVLAHRLALDPEAKFSGVSVQSVVERVLQAIPVPA